MFGPYPRSAGNSKEWRCPVKLTLEELFHGKHLRLRLTRYLLSNKKKHAILDIDVPPGCRPGTKIICPGIGHERKDGSLQDIVFVVDEVPHARFSRLQKNGDDLGMDVKLPWVKTLEKEKGEVHFKGIDGKNMAVKIDYPNDRHMEGTHVVVGAGMPIRQEGEGVVTRRRGDLVVRFVSMPYVLVVFSDFTLDGRL
jgi:DnaJ family protein B protein 4